MTPRSPSQPDRGLRTWGGIVERTVVDDYSDGPARGLRVLVADDEAPIRKMLTEILTELGHDVVVVASGADALQCLATEVVELVLTDLDMPGVNGWDVIDGAKARNPNLPVLLVTGWGHDACASEGRKRPDAVVPKPVNVVCLEKAIARIVPGGP
jgi:CheY-like chemotaxis protein